MITILTVFCYVTLDSCMKAAGKSCSRPYESKAISCLRPCSQYRYPALGIRAVRSANIMSVFNLPFPHQCPLAFLNNLSLFIISFLATSLVNHSSLPILTSLSSGSYALAVLPYSLIPRSSPPLSFVAYPEISPAAFPCVFSLGSQNVLGSNFILLVDCGMAACTAHFLRAGLMSTELFLAVVMVERPLVLWVLVEIQSSSSSKEREASKRARISSSCSTVGMVKMYNAARYEQGVGKTKLDDVEQGVYEERTRSFG